MTSHSADLCLEVSWKTEADEFTANPGWIAGAFFLGLAVGGGLAALLLHLCLKDCAKKKRQDEEESMLKQLERENDEVATATSTRPQEDTDLLVVPATKTKGEKIKNFFRRKTSKNLEGGADPAKSTGWVGPDGKGKQDPSVGLVGILTKDSRADAESELNKQDINDIHKLDQEQRQAKDDMTLKMLKIKLRKMKGKNLKDPYLAEFSQKILNNRQSNQEMIDTEQKEAEQELRKRHGKNKAALDADLDKLNMKMDAKRRGMEKDEFELMRSELLRTSGLSETEVDDMLEKLKQELADLERKQGMEQSRQARSLAERLEKRRQLLAFRKLQEQQSKEKTLSQATALGDPLDKLVSEEKLTDKQRKEILDEHNKNLQNLQKEHELSSHRHQSELSEKLQKRRDTRMKKLQDKHEKEKATFLERGEKSNNAEDYMNTYHKLLQQQHAETDQVQGDMDQTDIQELEKLTQTLEAEKDQKVADLNDSAIQKVTQSNGLADSDAKRIIKLHKLRTQTLEAKRRDERERMKANLQEKWKQKMMKLEEEQQNDQNEREAMLEQQESTIQQVLNSNLDLTDDAKEKILREHERNMIALNNQLARSKLTQKMKLEEKMAARKGRLADLQVQQEAAEDNPEVSEKEKQNIQNKMDEEMALFEKERKEAENALRKSLAQETKEAMEQQERNLAILIGRLEVGQARRQAVLQKQDKTLQKLQAQLEQTLEAGRLPNQMADQIIQQHYNHVEHINESMQHHRERQEQIINEKIQAKRYKKQRELEEQLAKERQDMHYHRKQAGVGMASAILNQALMENRQQKAMEELERDMHLELEKMREQLNADLQQSLEKDLDQHKRGFLKQLASAGKLSSNDMEEIERTASRSASQATMGSLSRAGRRQSYERPGSTLGRAMEDDTPSDEDDRPIRNRRPVTAGGYSRGDNTTTRTTKKKKYLRPTPPQPRPAFQTSTGEQIHGTWDLEDDSDEL